MTSEGASPEQITRGICDYRNQSRINSYIDKNGRITNMEGYNNALERAKKNSYENLIKSGKTPEQIIKSATKGNPALQCLNKDVRKQMKATFEAALQYNRKVYYQFEGAPAQTVIDKLYEYSERYGVEIIIDVTTLGVSN